MLRWRVLIGLSGGLMVFAVGSAHAQAKASRPELSTQDYIEIQQLYAAYTHAYDHGDADGHDYAGVFTPDGTLVIVRPAANPCEPVAGWQPANRDLIRGSITDKKKIPVCVFSLTGAEKLAKLAIQFKERNGLTERHVNTNLLITPTPEGATGTLYLNQLTIKPKPPTWSTSGIYDDTLVRTPMGWRFKKRIITQDSVFAGRPN
jgi:hypothetical protein